MKNIKAGDLIIILTLLLWIVLFLILTNVNLIFSGDSIEYLNMAQQINDSKFPVSKMWMPLYPIMIWLTAKLFFVNLLIGAKIYHLIITTTLLFVYIKLFIDRKLLFTWKYMIMISPIFCYYSFLIESITIMAEIQFLFLLILILHLVIKYFHEPIRNLFVIINCLILLSIFTKYNGFVFLLFFVVVVFYKNDLFKALKLSFYCLIFNGFFYLLWLKIKPGGDFLMVSFKFNNYHLLIDIVKDYYLSLFKYFTPFRISRYFENIVIQNSFLLFLIFLAFSFFLLLIMAVKFYKKKLSENNLILILIFCYSLLLVFRQYCSGINEIDTRTLFYVLFLLSFLIARNLIKKNYFFMKLLYIFPIMGTLQVLNSLPNQFKTGSGALVIQEFQENSPMIKVFKNKLKELKLRPQQIYSNENKIISIYTGFNKVCELPQSMQFSGNEYVYDEQIFEKEKADLLFQIANNNWLIIYKNLDKEHPRYDIKLDHFMFELMRNKNYAVFTHNNCYCIWKSE
jgi:hypothetical protein